MNFLKKYPIFSSMCFAWILAFGWAMLDVMRYNYPSDVRENITALFVMSTGLGAFIIYPAVLTMINIVTLFWRRPEKWWLKKEKQFEYITVILGCIYSVLAVMLFDIQFSTDWPEQLINSQMHTPVWTGAWTSVLLIGLVGVLGYLILSLVRLEKMPPLVIVFGIAGMYLGVGLCILWTIQVFSREYFLLIIFPLNVICIAAKTIRYKIAEWNEIGNRENHVYKKELLNILNQKLEKAEHWPFAAFLLMWPLLGILIVVLALFGQEPDAVIKAWTETSEWNLSQRVSPQNIQYDMHYLCTVAAGGHAKVVKPLRMGIRHGHCIVVNRQLCVANAFEQVLEERVPNLHRHLRCFYDTYGFPVAKMIHSPYVADGIYILMKPLEWIFLTVIYACDVHPENRIAVQYFVKGGLK